MTLQLDDSRNVRQPLIFHAVIKLTHVYLTVVATLCTEALRDSMDLHAVLKMRHSDGLAVEAGINEFADGRTCRGGRYQ